MALLLDTPAVHRRTDGLLRVTGPDRLTYLHSLLSQDLENAATGTAADFLYLDAKGNAQAMGRAVVVAGAVLLVVPGEVATPFAAALERFTFLLDAVTENLTGHWGVASVRGPAGVEIPGARSQPLTVAPAGDGFVVRDRWGGVDLIGPPAWLDERIEATGLPAASAQEWEAWRMAAGEPAWGREVIDGRRAQELGLLATHVHLRKGCYPGQESIAKIYNLGRPRRMLAVAEFSGGVNAGDVADAGGKPAEITSAVRSGAVTLALVLVPVDRDGSFVGDGALVVGSTPGRVRRLVGADLVIPGA